MKNSLLFLMVSLCLAGPALAECRYFRVSYQLMQCKEVAEKDLKDIERQDTELPDVTEEQEGKLFRVRCSCDYTLSGSDPRCDFDHSDEQTSLVGAEIGTDPCKKGKPLCETVCTPTR